MYVFFWVFPRRLIKIAVCRRFGTFYQFHLQRLDVRYEAECSKTSAYCNFNQTLGKYPKEYIHLDCCHLLYWLSYSCSQCWWEETEEHQVVSVLNESMMTRYSCSYQGFWTCSSILYMDMNMFQILDLFHSSHERVGWIHWVGSDSNNCSLSLDQTGHKHFMKRCVMDRLRKTNNHDTKWCIIHWYDIHIKFNMKVNEPVMRGPQMDMNPKPETCISL